MTEHQKQKAGEEPKPAPSELEDEPFLIDPGNEDPGAGIDQLPPQPATEDR